MYGNNGKQEMLEGFGTPTFDMTAATIATIAHGAVEEKINVAIARAGRLMADTLNYPIGSEFKVSVSLTFTKTDDSGSVEHSATVKLIAPDLRKVGSKLFITNDGTLQTVAGEQQAEPINDESRGALDHEEKREDEAITAE